MEKIKEFLKNSGKKLAWQFAFGIVACIILVWCVLQLLRIYTAHGEYITVPNLSKKTLTEVGVILDKQQLRYEVLDSTEYDPKYPPL